MTAIPARTKAIGKPTAMPQIKDKKRRECQRWSEENKGSAGIALTPKNSFAQKLGSAQKGVS